jgi:GntR family transcriptional regulator
MDPQWTENAPIYRQLRDRVVAMILEGVLKEGDPLPSVRNVAAEFRINPLTVKRSSKMSEADFSETNGRGLAQRSSDSVLRSAN